MGLSKTLTASMVAMLGMMAVVPVIASQNQSQQSSSVILAPSHSDLPVITQHGSHTSHSSHGSHTSSRF